MLFYPLPIEHRSASISRLPMRIDRAIHCTAGAWVIRNGEGLRDYLIPFNLPVVTPCYLLNDVRTFVLWLCHVLLQSELLYKLIAPHAALNPPEAVLPNCSETLEARIGVIQTILAIDVALAVVNLAIKGNLHLHRAAIGFCRLKGPGYWCYLCHCLVLAFLSTICCHLMFLVYHDNNLLSIGFGTNFRKD